MSEETTVQYLVSVSRHATSTHQLQSMLMGSEDPLLPDNEQAVAFCGKLFDKFGKKVVKIVEKQETEKIIKLAELTKYRMLGDESSDNDDDDEELDTEKLTKFQKDLQEIT